ncbi:MAG: zinc ABC transporter substrate-binding protein [Candidatus Delongbacteria bacterium]
MKRSIFLALILILFVSCVKNSSNSKPVISVSILPQEYFVKRITGDKFNINVLLPPGVSPHTFEPAPSTMSDLARSDIYFTMGEIEFEKAWLNKFRSVNEDMIISNSSKNANYIKFLDHGDDHEHDHTGNTDPHIWMSPEEVKTIANNIYEEMVQFDPDNKKFYKKNLESFITDLEKLDMQIRTMLSEIKNRRYIIYHPSLGYFARDYQLVEIPIEIDGKEPSPKQIKKIIDTAQEQNISTVFIQKQFDARLAESIAEEINGKVMQLDPLSKDWLNNMIKIARTMQFEEK